ncbi:T9SS type A sorting domain-containing protein [Chryseobacterium chendengshani]|uniref:T9SS type A sorting domain-containing protein n=1 Tax=Chryseobacterium sp. LJ668 TaxID=2864040 RepID=UPI001C68C28A|nr:T9SS type A sorting domain-containing protein [Chryseobacterium sp. LJ668]MBW8522127.1 T9SS type A sorting domain-containing protein [Chryseobacterium sp. LJ668]QYK17774.1 T9SS type A sorting domain-containing protein [Chryseobacterium sp. LJ668]
MDPNIEITQTVNQKGAVVIKGNFSKPVTSDHVVLIIKYKNDLGNWISVWHRTFIAANEFSQILTATFELPASSVGIQNIKIELSSNSSLSNWQSIIWQKTVAHYKQSDYTTGKCQLDENEYTYLFTPKTSGTVVLNPDGTVQSVKDRVTSLQLPKKLDNIALSINANGTLDNSNPEAPVINIENPNNLATIASSQKFIYQGSDTSPWEYSYHDPVYMFAGKFSSAGFFINFSNWFLPPEEGGEDWGRGYLDFKNPNALVNRYYNLYNYINEKLTDVITNQEPVVIIISKVTGLRIYKANGSYVTINALSNYNTTNDYGYPPLYDKDRGPGSENFFLSNTSKASIYGVGAIRNRQVTPGWNGTSRPLAEIETEINKFINYVGIFGNTINPDTAACITINPGAQPDAVDWTKAPNSYIFTGKDKNGNNVDGLYIPVKKAYEMWKNGGEFMRNDNGNYTPIPSGAATAGLYWEDEVGLVKSVALEGTGENAKIKVLVNKLKEGNAVISYRINSIIYWTWHIWATDDPTNGSTYHHGFEKDKDGNVVANWKWMDRNLGATNVNFVGNDWHKSAGLQYQWGRKDPIPSFSHKDLDTYGISGEVNLKPTDSDFRNKFLRIRGNKYSAQLNTGTDTPNGNIRFSIHNPINIITTPIYVATKGQPLLNDGEDFLKQRDDNSWMPLVSMTTWFSKNKYKVYNPPYRENIVAWDLWGDTRSGFYSDIDDSKAAIANQSSRYALKSPYDPCPCNWRVPSKYFSGGRNSSTAMPNQNRYSPWGKHTGETVEPEFKPDVLNTDYPNIKIYPQFGFDFSAVPGMNLGKFPINGNYEAYPNNTSPTRNGTGWATPELAYQDSSADGGLFTSTFTTATEVIDGQRYPTFGANGLLLYSDPLSYHTSIGWNSFRETAYGYPSTGVRCIYDPNSASTPQEFETEYITSSSELYSLDLLKSWTKLPNSYVEYTNPALVTPNPNGNSIDTNKDNDRIIEIPLKKAYAMNKLYLNTDFSFPAESTKSSSVVWTSNTSLIQKMEIIDGSIETALLKITLNQNQIGNAVVAFHVGSGAWSNGKHNDPVVWSWHIWAPKSVITAYSVDPETIDNGGIKPANEQFLNPTTSGYGAPMKTTFMDRDLGARMPFINEHFFGFDNATFTGPLGSYNNNNPSAVARLEQIRDSGGLHFQWGRKDPLPVFYNPGIFYNYFINNGRPFNIYYVYRQKSATPATGLMTAALYTANMTETEYLNSNTQSFATYSAAANVSASDSKIDKLKKVLKYSVSNPFNFLYQTDTAKFDWLSEENGNMPERWGHASEKSPYDPCPAGWRIVDVHSLSLGAVLGNLISKGNTPWFYNAKFTNAYGMDPGNMNAMVSNEPFDMTKMKYPGSFVYGNASGYGSFRYGFVLNKPNFNIGLFPNNGIRGLNGGNTLDATKGGSNPTFMKSGIWTAANHGSGNSFGMFFNADVSSTTQSESSLYFLTPSYVFKPQAAMSCRCAKIEYDANGNEIGRYNPDAIPVPPNANRKASNTLDKTEVKERAEKLTVFPNPVKDILHIDAKDDKDYYYQIYNMSGQLVKEGKFDSKQTNVSSLVSGVYLIRINNSETIVKIIKQ